MMVWGWKSLAQSAYIAFVEGSAAERITLAELQRKLLDYRDQTARTGQQLNWDYAEAAFPYTIETKPGEEDRWFYLKGKDPLYRYIVFGISERAAGDGETARPCIQVVLPDDATHGDKAKANELCKFLAKQYKAALTMFNGRTIYYNPRK